MKTLDKQPDSTAQAVASQLAVHPSAPSAASVPKTDDTPAADRRSYLDDPREHACGACGETRPHAKRGDRWNCGHVRLKNDTAVVTGAHRANAAGVLTAE